MKITTLKILLSISIVLLSFISLSQEWTAQGDATSWADSDNWNTGAVPGSGDNVIVPGGVFSYPEISGNVEIQDLEIATGATVTLLPNNTLTITGTLTEDGALQTTATACLVLDDSGADLIYTAEDIPNAPTGNATQEFCQGATIEDLEATGDNILWYADASSTTALGLTDELDDNTSYFATQTINGCESSDRFEVLVTILQSSTGEETYTGCQGDGYEVIVNGNTYNEANPTGTETLENAAANGCDSIVTIDLTFQAAATGEETYSGCEGDGYEVIVNGNTYNEANPTGTETLENAAANGCDSIVTINLDFITEINTTDQITACGSYEWIDGNVYTSSNNTATMTLTSVGGCDSIVTLNLTIQDELNSTINEVLNSSGTLVLIAAQGGASYQWLDCDNGYAPITNANNQTFVPQNNGSYAVAISKGICSDTSACTNINDLSTSESSLASTIKVYPNPTKDVINIQTNGVDGAIEVVDALGRFITSTAITSNNTIINLSDNNKGVYLLRVVQNNEIHTIRVVLN